MLIAVVAAADAKTRPIRSGVITVGRGANGVELGMTRAQVIATLGKPLSENSFGTMSYDPPSGSVIFDVYRKSTNLVQQIIVAGGNFTLSDGNHIFAKGGLRRVARRYGKRLKFHRFEDGSPYYEIVSRLHGRRVITDFPTDRRSLDARVLDVFVLFA